MCGTRRDRRQMSETNYSVEGFSNTSAIDDELTARLEKLKMDEQVQLAQKNHLSGETSRAGGKPKTRSGYQCFVSSCFSPVLAQLVKESGVGEEIKSRQVFSEIGKRWRVLSSEEKKAWNVFAKTDRVGPAPLGPKMMSPKSPIHKPISNRTVVQIQNLRSDQREIVLEMISMFERANCELNVLQGELQGECIKGRKPPL